MDTHNILDKRRPETHADHSRFNSPLDLWVMWLTGRKRMDIEKSDLVEIERKGDATQDLMYAGFKAKVVDVYAGGQAFVNLDDYTRATGELQAVSGSTMWPTSKLKKIEAT